MRKTIIILFAVFLVLAATKATYAETILYTQAKSNLRAGPSTKHKIVKVLALGEAVRVGQLNGKWYEVLDPETKVIGYIFSDLVGTEIHISGNIVGKWKGDIPGLGMGKFEQYALFKDGSNYHMLREYYDDSKRKNALTVKKVDGELRYYKKEKAYVEYYVIHGNGDLGLYDKLGLIRAIKRTSGTK